MRIGTQAYIMLWKLEASPPLILVLLGRLSKELLDSWAHVRACPAILHPAHCLWDICGRLKRMCGLWIYGPLCDSLQHGRLCI